MLRLTVKPGEYLMVGKDVKVIFTGGSANNLHVMVDAPKEINIVRSKAAEKKGTVGPSPYYPDEKTWVFPKKKSGVIITKGNIEKDG